MDTERILGSVRDEEGLSQLLEDYENYKDSDNMNQYYPDAMKGKLANHNTIYNFLPKSITALQISSSRVS